MLIIGGASSDRVRRPLGEHRRGGFRACFLGKMTLHQRRGTKKAKRQGTAWKAWGMASSLEYPERVCMGRGNKGKGKSEGPGC